MKKKFEEEKKMDKVESFRSTMSPVEEVSLDTKKTNVAEPIQKLFHTADNKKSKPVHSISAKTKRKHIEHLFKDNIRNEFGVGLIKIVTNPHIVIKLFWIVCLMGSLAISSYLIIGNFMEYFHYEVTTTVRQLYESPSLFPEVIICNQNLITTKTGYTLSMDPSFPADPALLPTNTQALLGHSLNDILLSCTFNGIECSASDFYWFLDRNLGNCYAFNSGNNSSGQRVSSLQSIRAGSDFGLQLTWYSNFYEKLSMNNSYNGLIVKVVNSSSISIDDGIFVSPGFVTNVAIERYFELMLPQPYSDCDVPNDVAVTGFSDLYMLIFNSAYEYTQQLCLNLCYQQDVIANCNCNPYSFPFFGGEACTDLTCINNVTKQFLKSDYVQTICLPKCPLQCNRTGFLSQISFSQLNGDYYLSMIQNNANLSGDFVTKALNAESARNSIAQVNIFYDTLAYTYAEELPGCNVICLFANIGGSLGLFMGASILSIGEIIEVFMEMYFMFRKHHTSVKDQPHH